MKRKDKKVSKKLGKSYFSIVLYVVATVVALVGVALLTSNIFLFTSTVNQYVAQGYPVATVVSQLIPSQLLPGVFEPIGLYGGIAFILFGIGKVNKKVSKCLSLLTKDEANNDIIKESVEEQKVVEVENTEITEQIESTEEVKKID